MSDADDHPPASWRDRGPDRGARDGPPVEVLQNRADDTVTFVSNRSAGDATTTAWLTADVDAVVDLAANR